MVLASLPSFSNLFSSLSCLIKADLLDKLTISSMYLSTISNLLCVFLGLVLTYSVMMALSCMLKRSLIIYIDLKQTLTFLSADYLYFVNYDYNIMKFCYNCATLYSRFVWSAIFFYSSLTRFSKSLFCFFQRTHYRLDWSILLLVSFKSLHTLLFSYLSRKRLYYFDCMEEDRAAFYLSNRVI
jgi:hypothetical protein